MLRVAILSSAVALSGGHEVVTCRRTFSTLGAASVASASVPWCLAAGEPEVIDTTVSDVIGLELSVGGEKARLELELFGKAAPASVGSLVAFARGELEAACAEEPEADLRVPSRVRMNQANIFRQCLDGQGSGVSLVGSSVWRIVPNRRVDLGRVSSRFVGREPPPLPLESTGLAHTRGAVSLRRGGGSFEFTLAPRDNPALDREDLVVVGRVSAATLPVLDLLNELPTKRDPFELGAPFVPPLGANFARACEYSSPDPTCAQYKPLRKVIVTSVKVAAGA